MLTNWASNITNNQTSLRASHYVLPMLTESSLGKVHSVFKNGLNVKVGERLAFLGKGSYPISGLGLNFENDCLLDHVISQVKEGTVVKFKQDSCIFYTRPQMISVKFSDLKNADLTLPKNQLITTDQYEYVVQAFKTLDPFSSSGFNDRDYMEKIYISFIEGNVDLATFVDKVIGLGIGLTPSGDDFIQGMMMAEAVYGKSQPIKEITRAKLLIRSTTDVSIGYYDLLFHDIALNEIWLIFLKMIRTASHEELTQQLIWMRRYGHTSGSDLLLGFETYLKKYWEEQKL